MNNLLGTYRREAEPTIRLNSVGRRIDREATNRPIEPKVKRGCNSKQLSANAVPLVRSINEKHSDMPQLPQVQHADHLLATLRDQGCMVCAIEVSQRLGCGVAMKLLTPLLRIERCDKLIEDLPGKQRSRTQFSFASQTTVNGGCHAVGSLAERLGLVDRFPQRAQVFTDDLHQSQNIKTETSSVRARGYVPLSGIQEKMAL